MRVHLAYGKEGLDVDLPSEAQIIEPRFVPGLPNETAALRQALRRPLSALPLSEQVRPDDSVVIVHSDITRAMPNDRVLPVVLAELEAVGVSRAQITLLNALGTHRPQTDEELRTMLGAAIVENYRCLQHDAEDENNLVSLGESAFGHSVSVNRRYMDADFKILTGFIEPHFFAGFSGGPKAVLPGITGAASVQHNHGAHMIGHSQARWGVTYGNPLWEEMLEMARRTEPNLLLNVTLNRQRQITGVFAGDLEVAHQAGCDFCRQSAMVEVPHGFDIVVTTNSGYPLDLNLYQAVKGMSAAADIVRPGGSIIVAAQCWDGLPDHGAYAQLLRAAPSPDALLQRVYEPGFSSPDQWQVQIQAQIQQKADVYVYSEGLSDDQIRAAHLLPTHDISATVQTLLQRYGADATLCVLPEGPQTVPYLRQTTAATQPT